MKTESNRVGAVTLADMYRDFPVIVVRLIVYRRSPRAVAEEAKRLLSAISEDTLFDLAMKLEKAGLAKDVRADASFAPVKWYSPDSWGRYGWPLKTLVKEGIAGRRFKVVVLPDVDEPGFDVLAMLVGLYHSLPLVAEREHVVRGGALEEDVYPIAVLLDEEAGPRRSVIFTVEPEDGYYRVEAYTAYRDAIPILRSLGFDRPSITEPVPGFPVYKLDYRARIESVGEAKSLAEEWKRRLGSSHIMGFIHLPYIKEPLSKITY